MRIKTAFITIVLFCSSYVLFSQDLPTCNLYMFTITSSDDGYSIRYPKFLSAFNKDGYNNQPSFLSDFTLYCTTNSSTNGSTEVVSLDLFEKKLTRITNTIESEYSPTSANKNFFSTVRVAEDGVTQNLVLYPKSMKGTPKMLFPDIGNVGYHEWISEEEIALFLVEENGEHILAIGNAFENNVNKIISNIGRTLKYNDKGQLYFIHKSVDAWFIKTLNPETSKIITICETMKGVEDFELMKDGTLIAGKDSKLFYNSPNNRDQWTNLIDLSDYGISNITRIALRKNKLVLVDNQ